MPGALVYTDDDLNIVFCNDRFKEMYLVPSELLQSGRPYPAFLRHLAEHGYYGEGDVDALVARRVESLRHPSGRSFEDHAPGGRWFRILRCRVAAGGTVTVMTDVTEQKRVERDLADKEAELHVARANMPGARRVESLRHPRGRASRTTRPLAAGFAFCGVGWWRAAR
jgi:PAS domain-containing protein